MWKRKKRVSPDKKGESFLEKGKKLAGKINGKEGRTVRKITVIIKKIFRGTGGNTINDLKNAFGHINPRKAILAVGGAVVVIYLLTGIYIVSPGEQAVIRRFGVVQVQPVEEGLHYRLPFPIDQVQKVNVSEVRRADVGMSLPEHVHQPEEEPQAIQLLTGDENIITTQAVVHYKVVDAAKFLYNINGSSEQLVRYSVESALVRMMANTAVDDVLSSEKVVAQNNILQIAQNILDKYDAHSRIPRLKYFGECLEMDACEDYWLGIDFGKITLHGAIDNATGTVCGLYFDKHETLNGYYHLFERIWRKYGVPAKFLTDNRTVFIYNGLKQKSMEKDTLTQFGYACHQLGVELVTTSIPEKKSRIERLWETLLSRLTVELRLAGINNIEDANEFLNTYTTKYNKRFALPIDYTTSVFEMVDNNLINNK